MAFHKDTRAICCVTSEEVFFAVNVFSYGLRDLQVSSMNNDCGVLPLISHVMD